MQFQHQNCNYKLRNDKKKSQSEVELVKDRELTLRNIGFLRVYIYCDIFVLINVDRFQSSPPVKITLCLQYCCFFPLEFMILVSVV